MTHGTPEQRIFDGLKHMIAVRKAIPAFADFNNRELIEIDNPYLFAFLRSNPAVPSEVVLVVANFDSDPQHLDLTELGNRGEFQYGQLKDLHTGEFPAMFKDQLVVPPFHFYWLSI